MAVENGGQELGDLLYIKIISLQVLKVQKINNKSNFLKITKMAILDLF